MRRKSAYSKNYTKQLDTPFNYKQSIYKDIYILRAERLTCRRQESHNLQVLIYFKIQIISGKQFLGSGRWEEVTNDATAVLLKIRS